MKFYPSIDALVTWYYSNSRRQWLRKYSRKIAIDADADEVREIAKTLQEFRDRNHGTPPDEASDASE